MGVGGQALVWPILVFWALQLDFETLHPDLEPVHSLDGRLGARRVVKADESEALALIGRPVYVNLGTYNCSERHEHLCQLGVPELLG